MPRKQSIATPTDKVSPPPSTDVTWLLWVESGAIPPKRIVARTADRAKQEVEPYFGTHRSNIRCKIVP